MFSYNHDFNSAIYTKPVLDYQTCQAKWASLTTGMEAAEIKDLEEARDKLAHYTKIYDIVEYCSRLHDGITALENRIQSNNPGILMNMWRKCEANNQMALFKEME